MAALTGGSHAGHFEGRGAAVCQYGDLVVGRLARGLGHRKTLRQWSVVNLASAVLAFSLDLTVAERGLILALGLLVLAAEVMTPGWRRRLIISRKPMIRAPKKAKDCGSAAVALTAIAGWGGLGGDPDRLERSGLWQFEAGM